MTEKPCECGSPKTIKGVLTEPYTNMDISYIGARTD